MDRPSTATSSNGSRSRSISPEKRSKSGNSPNGKRPGTAGSRLQAKPKHTSKKGGGEGGNPPGVPDFLSDWTSKESKDESLEWEAEELHDDVVGGANDDLNSHEGGVVMSGSHVHIYEGAHVHLHQDGSPPHVEEEEVDKRQGRGPNPWPGSPERRSPSSKSISNPGPKPNHCPHFRRLASEGIRRPNTAKDSRRVAFQDQGQDQDQDKGGQTRPASARPGSALAARPRGQAGSKAAARAGLGSAGTVRPMSALSADTMYTLGSAGELLDGDDEWGVDMLEGLKEEELVEGDLDEEDEDLLYEDEDDDDEDDDHGDLAYLTPEYQGRTGESTQP